MPHSTRFAQYVGFVLIALAILISQFNVEPRDGPSQKVHENVEAVMIDTEQIMLMESKLKTLILQSTQECPELHDYLKSSEESLSWIAGRATDTMLNLAVALDDVFGPNLLSLMLKQ